MKLARRLEQRMEGLVEGLSAAVFRGRIHPVELADRLVRYTDREAAGQPEDATMSNSYSIHINAAELPEAVDATQLQRELELVVAATAADRGWRLDGPATVTVIADSSVGRGRIEIQGRVEPGPLPAWAQLIDAAGGRVRDLGPNRAVVGRAPESDVELDDPKVSRRHAVLFHNQSGAWIEDAGSANGTYVNDEPVSGGPAAITTGDAVRFGPATFTFKEL